MSRNTVLSQTIRTARAGRPLIVFNAGVQS